MSFYAPPNQQRALRACMVCSVVQIHTVRASPPLRSAANSNKPDYSRNSCVKVAQIARAPSNFVETMMLFKNVHHRRDGSTGEEDA
ncbi:hypothetical protein PDIG_30900 [Penicillium digitatum PHI26]|uniref:Uncharacterized protein n=2 Tax=Penicillium digitatum TaxID=36651 RepID=K9G184_PEND2|nr:hypothetical protein PDIP_50480 [Penicillium digitatum Pd1]EKV12863.1 hypothetical protein PDIP_50480 [Penicillium digitatum Pd1]EKV14637.1 hypothetical protein PDIG_30900 [Penicillium digitatum PHI26]